MDKLKSITMPVIAGMLFGAATGIAVHLFNSRKRNAEAQSQSAILSSANNPAEQNDLQLVLEISALNM